MPAAIRMFVSIHARAGRATYPLQHQQVGQRFQFTPARGGRPHVERLRSGRTVSIHARAGRATKETSGIISSSSFNSRPRGAGDLQTINGRQIFDVSIHARAGRATRTRPKARRSSLCFNSRPRGAGDTGRTGCRSGAAVSIHARAGRATVSSPRLKRAFMFQFTPARGGRLYPVFGTRTIDGFQFTPARGGRRSPKRSLCTVVVSIHARAGRATRLAPNTSGAATVSIHARAGRATALKAQLGWTDEFQFTPARGGRRLSWLYCLPCFCFNSRPRGAGDRPVGEIAAASAGFNSRPRGAGDKLLLRMRHLHRVSIHARAGRATATILAIIAVLIGIAIQNANIIQFFLGGKLKKCACKGKIVCQRTILSANLLRIYCELAVRGKNQH